ncbi:NADH-ubiquinone/plastoquinone oxidoreductase chain 6 [uncultured archaeon]|nr:NADH-ubiquinone/plastoquinone oxidoreductase chain 6 [uncultured archaeon]
MVKFKIIILTLAFLATLLASLSLTDWGGKEMQPLGYEPKEGLRLPESGIGDVGFEIFTSYVFSFEILALVLTAALVGAVWVARKEVA